MAGRIAYFFSLVFHPLVIPTLIFAAVFRYAPILARPLSDEALVYILLAIFVTTFLIPLCSMGVLKLSTYISSLDMEDRKERVIPFLFVAAFYAITTYMFYQKMQLNKVLIIIMLAITVITLIVALTTLYWKISAHSAAICGMVGFFVGIMVKYSLEALFVPLVVSIVVAGLVMTSRLYLDSHRPSEIWTGGVLGFSLSFGAIIFF